MLNRAETDDVWKHMLEAEVRAYYFGDLAASYAKHKQVITFLTFFLASGAAATLVAQLPPWVPTALTTVTALLTSYSIAVGLDRKALSMAKLHAQWMQIAQGYQHLWHHAYEADAGETFSTLLARGAQASETATLEAPYIPARLDHWAEHVYSQYRPVAA